MEIEMEKSTILIWKCRCKCKERKEGREERKQADWQAGKVKEWKGVEDSEKE